MKPIYKDLYQFTDYIPPINLSLHQYLLFTDEPIFIHTGSIQHTEKFLPELKEMLQGRPLRYILVSHFESDECGGLSLFLKEFPNVVTICSQICARQLLGFGYKGNIEIKSFGDTLEGSNFQLQFIDYPSEIHLEDGLTFLENKRNIFFSSDLMFRFGASHDQTIENTWKEEVDAIDLERVSSPEKLQRLKENLMKINPKFIAVGHGYCVKLV